MKKYLLPQNGNFYKANLHCHTTVSDGKYTPEEIKERYMEKGYSIVAYTDHDVLIGHKDLNDNNFLALHGYEMEITESELPWRNAKTCHLCLIALEPDNLKQVCYHRSKYLFKNAVNYRDAVLYDENEPDFERVYSRECINEIIKKGRKNGFFVTYNHPNWSMESYNDYIGYEGMNAMEICNYSCIAVYGYDEYNEKEYDDMLRAGKMIYCVAADDNHNQGEVDDSFGGFVMIKAPSLNYKSVTDALSTGEFYASMGPEIYSLYVEDGTLFIECSDAESIVFQTDSRNIQKFVSPDGGAINKAQFELCNLDKYVRVTVTDFKGKHANTNAYDIDELLAIGGLSELRF